jgi:molecular chaperone GrpE
MSEDTREEPTTSDNPDVPEMPDSPEPAQGDPGGASAAAARADGPNFTLVDDEDSRARANDGAGPTGPSRTGSSGTGAASATAEDGATSADTTDAGDAAAGTGTLAALRDRVDQLERDLARERDQATEYMNRWQRAQADIANLRRRGDQERDQLHAFAAMQAVAFALPALDSLERAFQSLPETLRGLTWIDGVALVDMQLRRAVEALGVAAIEVEPGQPVDHGRHQPVAERETDAYPEGTVAALVQRGYEMNGHLLRPALVAVARPPRAQSAPGAEPAPGTGDPQDDGQDASPAGQAPPGSSP